MGLDNENDLLGFGAQFNKDQHRAAIDMSSTNHYQRLKKTTRLSSTDLTAHTSGTNHYPASVYNKQKEDGSGSQQDRNGYNIIKRWYQERASEKPWNGFVWQVRTEEK